MYTTQTRPPVIADGELASAAWTPLPQGTVQECVCDRAGCCTMLTVLTTEANVLEIYQANINSLWSCIARIVLPEHIALCQRVGPTNRRTAGGSHHVIPRRPRRIQPSRRPARPRAHEGNGGPHADRKDV